MNEKKRGLLLIGSIYAIAIALGVMLVVLLPLESLILRVAIADVVATAFVFAMSTLLKNSSIYDPYWSVAPMVMVLAFVRTFDLKTVLLLSAIFIWGIRLTLNWVYTFRSMERQDWRYDHFKNISGKAWPLVNFFGIHLMPTVVVFLAMLPAFLMLQSDANATGIIYLGLLMCLAATFIQTVSDMQMHRFKAEGGSGVLASGLWRYSRHPNYFGEILMWFGIYVMMLSVTAQFWAGIGALVNLAMFVFISIPLMENRQKGKHDAYADYCNVTSPLLFWPPKDDLVENRKEA